VNYAKVSSKVRGNEKSRKQARLRESPDPKGFNASMDYASQRKANRSSYYGHHATMDFDDSREPNQMFSSTMAKQVIEQVIEKDNVLVDKIDQRM